jgi:uncharacterized protein
MSYYEKISDDLKKAMLAREKIKLEALRAVKTAFTLAKSEKSADYILTEAEEIKILQKLVKQRKDSAAIYKEQNRPELFDKEVLEADIIEKYLPAMMSEQELERYISGIILQSGAKDIKDMGKVMGVATKELAGKADGKVISEMVRRLLA